MICMNEKNLQSKTLIFILQLFWSINIRCDLYNIKKESDILASKVSLQGIPAIENSSTDLRISRCSPLAQLLLVQWLSFFLGHEKKFRAENLNKNR